VAEIPYQPLKAIILAVTPFACGTCFILNVKDEPMNLFCLVNPVLVTEYFSSS
jgi:hypothetical protein